MFNWLVGSNMLVLLQPYKFGMVEMTIDAPGWLKTTQPD